ncbi:hypothetical protein, conserved [Plasmodium gonderi]|uniref:Uncharacterized protein n=1 Tax=Plasmodium gonderi TaxID=77519 RepID=A0A1Y1JLU6_PLAGO|nr:hypothetical protein, conserved [Plasmodium gonderi]GAW83546.1 hypothetical protein, conserved [Plasmodium gonderi]
MFKKYFIFIIVSIFSIVLVVYKKVKNENTNIEYYYRGGNNKGSWGAGRMGDIHGDRSSWGEETGECSLNNEFCSIHYSDNFNESQEYKIINYKDTRINKLKKGVRKVFHPFFTEMNSETNSKHIISLFIEFFENSKIFLIISLRSSYHMLNAYGIVLISLLKILFLWFTIIEPYLQWTFLKLKKLYINLDCKTKKYIISMTSIFLAFLYLLYSGIIKCILNKISQFYKYLLKKVFKINNFLFTMLPYIMSFLLYITLVKTIPVYYISFFIYSFFFPLPSVYSIVIILKYVYLSNINDCVMNTLKQKLDSKYINTITEYCTLEDTKYEKSFETVETLNKKTRENEEPLENENVTNGKKNSGDEDSVKDPTSDEEVREDKGENEAELGKEIQEGKSEEQNSEEQNLKEKNLNGQNLNGQNLNGQNLNGQNLNEQNLKEGNTNENKKCKAGNLDQSDENQEVETKAKKKKKIPFFNLENFGFNSKKKEKKKNVKESDDKCTRKNNQDIVLEYSNKHKAEEEKSRVVYYDVPILLEYWLFTSILKFINFFFFFSSYNKTSFMFEYFTLFVICLNISEKFHEFVFLKDYKSSILVRVLKNVLVSTVDFVLYTLFNVRLENEEKKEKKKTDQDMSYNERSNLLINISKIMKDKLKLNETVKFSFTCLKSVITENVIESVKLPLYIKIFINLLIYMPQLILLIFPSFILKIYFAYFFFILPIFGSLKCLEEKNAFHNKIYFICYFFFYNIASITVNHAFFKCLPFYNLYKILITITVQTVLKYIFNLLKVKS